MSKKELPDFFTIEGRLFYFLSKNRYVGVSTKRLTEEFKMSNLELLQLLVPLCERGLITIIQEGKTVDEDIWDIATDLRRKDPDIEKIIHTSDFLEYSLKERLKQLKETSELKELQRIKDAYELRQAGGVENKEKKEGKKE
ncbi:MAG: hypothetical protein ACTSO9_12410 [Candidatus Helarchaeota archaeon]